MNLFIVIRQSIVQLGQTHRTFYCNYVILIKWAGARHSEVLNIMVSKKALMRTL